jgi:hypothetical protein
MDTIKKLTELIEDGTIEPPTRPYRKPCEANFIDAAYDDDSPGKPTENSKPQTVNCKR